MVSINEDIKAVMRIANEINLAAINAMLISNKIGSSGFSVVSSELRAFSRRLGEAMQSLVEYVSLLVREVAGMIRLNKAMELQLATRSAAAHYAHWDAMQTRKSNELARNHESIARFRQKLMWSVARAHKLCVMGQSLSNSAKIEAVYGGVQALALRNVSEQVERSISEILSTLNKLGRQLEAA
ncbi:MAG: hypothetical protein HZB95_00070 [Nitrosomonadales bacterium]|nr:hypothetical protein [Nitrosomonadales bacterium]